MVKIKDVQTDQDKSVPGNSVDESVIKTNVGQTDQDKSVLGNSVNVSRKYTKIQYFKKLTIEL